MTFIRVERKTELGRSESFAARQNGHSLSRATPDAGMNVPSKSSYRYGTIVSRNWRPGECARPYPPTSK